MIRGCLWEKLNIHIGEEEILGDLVYVRSTVTLRRSFSGLTLTMQMKKNPVPPS
jgi:hypothetical protein